MRKIVMVCLALVLVFGFATVAGTQMAASEKVTVTGEVSNMARFDGYLFSKLKAIGSKSEGPFYFLQRWDYSETPVIKKTMSWEEDPNLQKFLGKKVIIEGTLEQKGIRYEKIEKNPQLGPVPMK